MYGSVANVVTLTGLRPTDVGFDTTDELDIWLQGKLDVIAVMIEKDRNRDAASFTTDDWTLVVDDIAERWCAAFARFTMANRDSPIVRIDDFNVEFLMEESPGKGILRDLRRIPVLITKRAVFESGVVKAAAEDATGF